jgi:hypothetical protein
MLQLAGGGGDVSKLTGHALALASVQGARCALPAQRSRTAASCSGACGLRRGVTAAAVAPDWRLTPVRASGLVDYVAADYAWARAVMLLGATATSCGLALQASTLATLAHTLSHIHTCLMKRTFETGASPLSSPGGVRQMPRLPPLWTCAARLASLLLELTPGSAWPAGGLNCAFVGAADPAGGPAGCDAQRRSPGVGRHAGAGRRGTLQARGGAREWGPAGAMRVSRAGRLAQPLRHPIARRRRWPCSWRARASSSWASWACRSSQRRWRRTRGERGERLAG